MKKSLAKEILAHLVTCGSRMMIGSFFVPYGLSLGQAIREVERSAELCPHDFSGHSRGTVSVTLHRMKKKKLVSISGSKKKAIWRITKKGRSHFKDIKNVGDMNELPEEDGKTRVFMFDIPENRKHERDWLRRELSASDYTILQKSVFVGTRPLPNSLLRELKIRGLLAYTHIVGLEGG